MNKSYQQQSLDFDKHLLGMPVKECGESLVSLPELFATQNIFVLFNGEVDFHAKTQKQYFLRKSVAKALASAAKEFLKFGMVLKVEDVYRNLATQKIKFLQEVENLQEKFPELPLKEVKAKANTYIAGIPILAAHTAGAAIDATLIYQGSLKPVNFGPSYHSLDETSITDYPSISPEAKKNRQLFKKIMEKHGLTNYPFEYWHFSMGDVCAAYINGEKEAIYAPIIVDSKRGEISGFVAPRSLHAYF